MFFQLEDKKKTRNEIGRRERDIRKDRERYLSKEREREKEGMRVCIYYIDGKNETNLELLFIYSFVYFIYIIKL